MTESARVLEIAKLLQEAADAGPFAGRLPFGKDVFVDAARYLRELAATDAGQASAGRAQLIKKLRLAKQWLEGDYNLTAGEPTIPVLRASARMYLDLFGAAADALAGQEDHDKEVWDWVRHAAGLRRLTVDEYVKRAVNAQLQREGVDAVCFETEEDR